MPREEKNSTGVCVEVMKMRVTKSSSLRRHAGAALAAAALRPIGGERHTLDVALVGDGDDHVLALDQVLVLDLALDVDDLGLPRRRELGLDRRQLVADDADDAGARAEDVEVVLDLGGDLLQVLADLVAAERGQALETQIEDRLRLLGGEAVGAAGSHAVTRIVDQLEEVGDVARGPVARHQLLLGLRRRRRAADQRDHLVDVGDRDGEADEGVGAIARLVEQVLGAAGDDLLAELVERGEEVLEVHLLGPAAVDGQHIGAERGLQVGVAPELVQHHVGDRRRASIR